MKRFLIAAFMVIVPSLAMAQDRVGFYYYNAFEEKPLPVGTPVWVNLWEGRCAYGDAFPSAADTCFEGAFTFREGFGEYHKAKIKKIFADCADYPDPCSKLRYFYRVEFEFLTRGRNGDPTSQWSAPLDEAFTAYNLPEKWAKYSKYFIRLYW